MSKALVDAITDMREDDALKLTGELLPRALIRWRSSTTAARR